MSRVEHAPRVLLISRTASSGSPPNAEDVGWPPRSRRRRATRTTIPVEGFTVEIHTP